MLEYIRPKVYFDPKKGKDRLIYELYSGGQLMMVNHDFEAIEVALINAHNRKQTKIEQGYCKCKECFNPIV